MQRTLDGANWATAELKYAKKLISNYKLLNVDWILKQRRVGAHSNIQLSFKEKSDWRASIHNLVPSDKRHLPENCILEIFEMNVSQHTAVPDLFAAYRELWARMLKPPKRKEVAENVKRIRENFSRSPRENGVVASPGGVNYFAMLRNLHLKHMIRKSICSHLSKDKLMTGRVFYETKEERDSLVKACIEKICNLQQTRCHYSGCLMSFSNDWTRVSFERLDNCQPHFLPGGNLSNVVFVCRILNSAAGWSKKKVLSVLLHQKEVFIPRRTRMNLTKTLQDLDEAHQPKAASHLHKKRKRSVLGQTY